MRYLARFGVLLCMLFAPAIVTAQDADVDDSDLPQRIASIIALGPGVHELQTDGKGRITSLVVVGQARISTVLGKAKGLETARTKANLDCSSQFVKWLKEDVTIYESSNEESVILMTGSEGEEADSLKEYGKAIEKTTKKMESLSSGIVRGLELIHKEVDAEGKTLTVVKGWHVDTSEATKRISKSLKSDQPTTTTANSEKPASGTPDKELQSESVTSKRASDFFSKRPKN